MFLAPRLSYLQALCLTIGGSKNRGNRGTVDQNGTDLFAYLSLSLRRLYFRRFRTVDDEESGLVRRAKQRPRDRKIGVIAGCCAFYETWRRFRWRGASAARTLIFLFSPVIFAVKRKTSRHAHATDPCTLVSLESPDHERPPSRFLALGARRRLVRHGNRPPSLSLSLSLAVPLDSNRVETTTNASVVFESCQRITRENYRRFSKQGRNHPRRSANVERPKERERERETSYSTGEKCALVSA